MSDCNDEEEKPKQHLITKIKKVYSNKFDAVKQSLKLARKNRREQEELAKAAGAATGGGDMETSASVNGNQVITRDSRFDFQGFGAIIAISFFSTGLLFSMKKYIFKQGEFWKHGNNYSSQSQSRQQYTYRTYHNHQSGYNRHNNNSSGSGTGNTILFDKDQMTKSYLSVLGLPCSNLRPSIKEVKAAYRKVSLRTHPDVISSEANIKSKKYMEERFIMATKAHDELLKILK